VAREPKPHSRGQYPSPKDPYSTPTFTRCDRGETQYNVRLRQASSENILYLRPRRKTSSPSDEAFLREPNAHLKSCSPQQYVAYRRSATKS
jgi:hypothetical protein